jgi:hypothetical protein
MKILFTLAVFATVILAGCNSSEKNRIVGKWTIDKAYVHRTEEAAGRFSSEQVKRIDSILNKKFTGITYTFSADGKVTEAIGGDQRTGTWEMGKDEKNGNAELSMIIMKGEGWEEAWLPAAGKSLFYLGEIDAINAKIMPPAKDGASMVYDLSKSKQ